MASSRKSTGPVLRSLSPSGRFSGSHRHLTSSPSSAASAFASSTFSSRPASFFHRSASPTRVNVYGAAPASSAVRFSFDRPTSPGRSFAAATPRSQVVQKQGGRSPAAPGGPKRTCMCSPTTHPGSFRCSLHKNSSGSHHGSATPFQSNRLNARRSAMTNSLVRIGTVEGDLVKRALAALIRPSSHHQRRRSAFQSRPSRLSMMSKAENL